MEKNDIDLNFEKKLNDVSESVKQVAQERERKLVETKYYKELVLNTNQGPLILNNVYITIERNKQGDMEYHFRWAKENEQGEMTVEEKMMADKNGNVYSIDGLKQYFENSTIDMETLFKTNDKEKGRLLAISREEIKEKKTEKDDETTKEQQEEEPQNDEQERKKAEKDLKKDDKEIEISNFRRIEDKHLEERMPNVFDNDAEYAIAYSATLGSFVVLEAREEIDEKGQLRKKWQVNDNVKTGGTNYRSIISISENGDKVERKVPYALLKTNRSDKEVAITLEAQNYGELDIETIDVMPCQERVARQVRTEGQGLEGEEPEYVRKELNRGYNISNENNSKLHNLAHGFEKEERSQKESMDTSDSNSGVITEDTEIPGTKLTYGDLAKIKGETIQELIEENGKSSDEFIDNVKGIDEKIKLAAKQCNMSVEGYVEELKKADGKDIDEKIENANEEIEAQYMGNSMRQH